MRRHRHRNTAAPAGQATAAGQTAAAGQAAPAGQATAAGQAAPAEQAAPAGHVSCGHGAAIRQTDPSRTPEGSNPKNQSRKDS